jgi:hypothetical protein
VAAGLTLLTATPSRAISASGGWLDRSTDHGAHTWAGSQQIDPIVSPGAVQSAHLHDFFCNTSIRYDSTYDSMVAGASTCPSGDTASYWAPALYKNGVKVDPVGPSSGSPYVREQIYYRDDNVKYDLADGKKVTPFPPNFMLHIGNSKATSAADNPKLGSEIYWGCSDTDPGKLKAPPNCSSGVISLHIGFPNCWDGVQIGGDDSAHVVYPSSYRCPADHPFILPRLIIRLEYPVGTDSSGITLSSGPTYTAHGDFWNTWNQTDLTTFVNRCLNTGTDCGTNPTP